MKEAVAIKVRDWVGDLGALKPAEGESLARHLIGRSGSAKITLDFAGIDTLASGFANAFFVELAGARPLAEWRDQLEFVGLGSRQAGVLTRSLRALRKADKAEAEPPSRTR